MHLAPRRPRFDPLSGRICWPTVVQFICVLKKISSPVLLQITGLRPVPFHMGCGAAVYRWGRGSEIFSTCVRRSSSYNTMPWGWSCPHNSSFFYIKSEKKTMHHSTLRINNSSTTMLSSLILYDSFISISQFGQLTIGVLIPIDSARTISPCAQLEASFACFHIESMMLTKANPFI